jgi:type II secretion system protein H
LTRARGGFSLLEMIAVVLIFGLLAAIAVPSLGTGGDALLRDAAESVAAELELARQRSVMTGVSHRLVLDLEEGLYRLEWLAPESAESLAPAETGAGPVIAMSPPAAVVARYQPAPHGLGRTLGLQDPIAFAAFHTETGTAVRGVVTLTFESDGTTEPATLVLRNAAGHTLALDVAALEDRVEIHDDSA